MPGDVTPQTSDLERSPSESPFFADAILDLDEAHDIAELATPEAVRAKYKPNRITPIELQVPNFLDRPEKKNFERITSAPLETETTRRPQTPRWPRDIAWAVGFWLFTPLALFWPIIGKSSESSPLASYPLSTATLHSLWWAAVATFLLSRLLYRSAGGGDGDDARHLAAQVLTLAAPLAVAVSVALSFFLWWACPKARVAVLVPVFYTVRDLFLFRRWKRRNTEEQQSASRQAFFQALTCMALDILSRSLRRASFYRVLILLLSVQLGVLVLWRWALLGALGGNTTKLIVAVIAGKWATGTVARLLSLLASGGVTNWFIEQSALLQDLPSSNHDLSQSSVGDELVIVEAVSPKSETSMPEAWTVDASIYQSVIDMDDTLDDDYEIEDEAFMEAPNRRESNDRPPISQSTVKSLLSAGLTVSFGSVAMCGLLGGPAQFIWSQVRKMQVLDRGSGGFASMQIGTSQRRRANSCQCIRMLWNNLVRLVRGFIRNYSDLAMSHVAVYYKSYQRAARDVAVLIDEAGKITFHILGCSFFVDFDSQHSSRCRADSSR
jgi:hypothetical protein